jgi:hypothetical protein
VNGSQPGKYHRFYVTDLEHYKFIIIKSQGNTLEGRRARDGARSPGANSLSAVGEEGDEEEELIVPNSTASTTSNHQTPNDEPPPPPTAPDWQSVSKCVDCVLDDRGIVIRFNPRNCDSNEML